MYIRVVFNADDKTSESQALEGLSSVFFQQKQYDRSLASLNDALEAVSADSSTTSSDARQRIVKKLNAVIKFQQTNLNTLQQTPVLYCLINRLLLT